VGCDDEPDVPALIRGRKTIVQHFLQGLVEVDPHEGVEVARAPGCVLADLDGGLFEERSPVTRWRQRSNGDRTREIALRVADKLDVQTAVEIQIRLRREIVTFTVVTDHDPAVTGRTGIVFGPRPRSNAKEGERPDDRHHRNLEKPLSRHGARLPPTKEQET
jgi:hypothetical protein